MKIRELITSLTSLDVILLIVRNLKRNSENDKVLLRLISEYYALPKTYLNKQHIFDCLFKICRTYDLLPHPVSGDNIQYFFTNREAFTPEFDDIWDRWIWQAKMYIRQSEVRKFARYPEPAYYRNAIKNAEKKRLESVARTVEPAIFIEYYSHESALCYKLSLPFTKYSAEIRVLCKVSEGIELARTRAAKILSDRIADALALSPTEHEE